MIKMICVKDLKLMNLKNENNSSIVQNVYLIVYHGWNHKIHLYLHHNLTFFLSFFSSLIIRSPLSLPSSSTPLPPSYAYPSHHLPPSLLHSHQKLFPLITFHLFFSTPIIWSSLSPPSPFPPLTLYPLSSY